MRVILKKRDSSATTHNNSLMLMSIDHFFKIEILVGYLSSIKKQSTTCQEIFFKKRLYNTKTNQTTFFFNDVFNRRCVVLSLKRFFFLQLVPNEHAFYYIRHLSAIYYLYPLRTHYRGGLIAFQPCRILVFQFSRCENDWCKIIFLFFFVIFRWCNMNHPVEIWCVIICIFIFFLRLS